LEVLDGDARNAKYLERWMTEVRVVFDKDDPLKSRDSFLATLAWRSSSQ
jgi:hypothetical protein